MRYRENPVQITYLVGTFVIPIYIRYGLVLDPLLSTLTIKEFEANRAKGIVTSFIVALLQFPVKNGRDRDDEGKLTNYSLSFVQNDLSNSHRGTKMSEIQNDE